MASELRGAPEDSSAAPAACANLPDASSRQSPYLSQAEAQAQLNLDKPVSVLHGAGGKRLEVLQALGLNRLRDIVQYYPFRYNNFTNIKSISQLRIGEKVAVVGRVDELRTRKVYTKRTGRELPVVEASIADDSGVMMASWFNQPWMARSLVAGMPVSLLGTVEHFDGFLRMSSPLHRQLEEAGFIAFVSELAEGAKLTTSMLELIKASIEPVYPARSGLSSTWIAKFVSETLVLTAQAPDPLPRELRERHSLVSRHQALSNIHHPPGREEYRLARQRLVYEEVLCAQISLISQRKEEERGAQPTEHRIDGSLLAKLPSLLPFALTDDQQLAIRDILADMHAPQLMNRLLLGDVGSGKTVVALHALIAAVDSGYQAAMIAPTTVLAEQYAIKLGTLLDDLDISWALLTGASTSAQRQMIYQGLADGSVQLVFGTHALLVDDLHFAHLSLAVIDEQHRFGVEQREQMRRKGAGLDILMMSATPIPRSLALVIYGEMTTTWLHSRPMPARVETSLISRDLLFQAYDAVRTALSEGHLAYIICPLIDGSSSGGGSGGGGGRGGTGGRSDGSGSEGDRRADAEAQDYVSLYSEYNDEGHIAAATQEVEMLRQSVFNDYRIELMTSRLSDAEKKHVMESFRAGETDILVSTTVVEVGVDVPNATVMIILDADRFGLAQLHQLRGRVGRGEHDGKVFLVSSSNNPDSLARLRVIERTADGLELAEMDLRLRREGDVLGLRQHGRGSLKMVNVIRDAELIAQAHDDAHALFAADPTFTHPENQLLAAQVARLRAL